MVDSNVGDWLKHKTGDERDRKSQLEATQFILVTETSHNQPQAGRTQGRGATTARGPWAPWWGQELWQTSGLWGGARKRQVLPEKVQEMCPVWPLPSSQPVFGHSPTPEPPRAEISFRVLWERKPQGQISLPHIEPGEAQGRDPRAKCPKTQLEELSHWQGYLAEKRKPALQRLAT